MTIHSSGQTIFSFTHIEVITLCASEEVDEVVGGASSSCSFICVFHPEISYFFL